MNKLSICIFALFLFISTKSSAQSAQAPEIKWQTDILVDGSLEEWGDSLSYYFEDQDIQYDIMQDDKYLYIACRVRDKAQQVQASLQGFSVMINPKGKKKEGPLLVFPIPDKAALRGVSYEDDTETEIRKKALNSIRALYIFNFSDIVDGPISLQNDFGIQASARLDSTDALCYEAAFALDQLKLNPDKAFALNLKINKVTRYTYYEQLPRYSRYGYSRYGYGYGNRQQRTSFREEPGIWLILKLTNT